MTHRKPHEHPHFDAPPNITTADPNATHPPAGVPTDADGFLAFLRARQFDAAQLVYLQGNALDIYRASPAFVSDPKMHIIADEWDRVRVEFPKPAGDPFNR